MQPFVTFYSRDLGPKISTKFEQLTVIPEMISTSVMGGPKSASLRAHGSIHHLFGLFDQLRTPVMIHDDQSLPMWWGYIHSITILIDATEITVSLDTMANRIAVEYDEASAGSYFATEQALTSWVSDSESINWYGTKELLKSFADTDLEGAEAHRDTLLEALKFPNTSWLTNQGVNPGTARIECKGWWSTLDWMSHSTTTGYVAYTEAGPHETSRVGHPDDREQMAQSFQFTGEAFDIATASVTCRKTNSPADNLVYEIHADSTGEPSGTALSSGSTSLANLTESYQWVKIAMSAYTLQPSTTYWLVVKRSGAISSSNYFRVRVNEELTYPDGNMLVWNGSAWVVHADNADMLFQISGKKDTTEQIQEVYDTVGQFFEGILFNTTSGVDVIPFNSSLETGKGLIEELLSLGTSNNRRLFATVTSQRWIEVSEEPAKPTNHQGLNYALRTDGRVTHLGNKIAPHRVPIGTWIKASGIIPNTVTSVQFQQPDLVMFDEIDYSFEDMQTYLYPKTYKSPWEL